MSKPSIKSIPKDSISLNDGNFTPVLIALFVVLIALVILFLWRKKKTARTDILLTGLCDSGKTLLFSQMIYEKPKETFTSIAENIADYKTLNGSAVRIVDIPGHERLRGKFFDQYKGGAKSIAYLVDSVTFQKDIRDVADFLYTILSDSDVSAIPVAIVCNKQDLTLAKGSNVVKSLLEKEINLVRTTRINQLQSVDNSSSSNVYLGKQGKDFEFAHLNRPVDIFECAAQKNDLDNLKNWLALVA